MIGQRIGPYEVTAKIGAGGMGEVYRARDTKLNRDVAIKVLPQAFAADQDRLTRFTREAQTLAALNHPNIAQIHGLEEAAGTRALIMEFVDGDELSALIAGGHPEAESVSSKLRDSGSATSRESLQPDAAGVGPRRREGSRAPRGLKIDDALPIARQIADALEAAHEAGIVHRDLKPANIKIKADGKVKVLDFGLAKAMDSAASGAAAMNSPTLTNRATEMGVILGTAAYMAPEQAKGKAVDKRADIWAFGVVLHEMLTGRRMFEAESVAETLGLIFARDPDLAALPADTPASVRDLIARCLVRDPRQRLRDIGDARIALESSPASAVRAPESSRAPVPPSTRARWYWPAALVASIVIAPLVAGNFWAPAVQAPSPVARLSIVLPPGHQLQDPRVVPLAVSPDGTHLVYAASAAGKVMLYHRALDAAQAEPIAGTEGGQSPFFKPDSKWVGFFAGGQLKKVALDGGALEVLCPAPTARGGSWGDDGHVYFAPTTFSSIWRVAETGGAAAEFTHLDREQGEVRHQWPQKLPGGGGLIFTVWIGPGRDEKSVAMQTAAGERRLLVRGGEHGRYVPPGYLVYARSDNLMAVPFDLERPGPASGAPTRLPSLVHGEAAEGSGFEVSSAGVLATLPVSSERLSRRVAIVDQSGRAEALPIPVNAYEQVRISPDGKQAIVQLLEGVVTLWLYDFERASLTPLVKASSSSQVGVWTVDSKRVIYRGTRKGSRNLYWRAADGTGVEERLTTKEGVVQSPQSVSSDGNWAIFSEGGLGTGSDLWKVSLTGDKKVQQILVTPTNETEAVVSPAGGGWLAYVADDAGRDEVYVQPFPGPGPRIPISRNGGDEPLWSRDGRQLFFLNRDKFMAADVTMSPAFSASAPRQLYEAQFMVSPNNTTSYSLAPDGKRLLRVQAVQPEQPATRIEVVVNWTEELRRLVK
jgi:serine/threonine protein kinase/Tol biopolymer transport system component